MSLKLTRNSRLAILTATLALAGGLGLVVAATDQAAQAGQAQAGQQQGQGRGAAQGRGGQTPARDAQATPVTGTGTITGSVSSGTNATPVRRARVTLSGPELRGGRSTVTNDQGVFTFAALPAGRFTMTASKAGYVDVPYGAKRPGRPGTPIQLAAGQKMENANISLPKGGVITGVVVDDAGEPSPGTQVRVMRYVMRTGERTLQQAGQGLSDDRGIYRIYGLQPGDYLVSAVPRNQGIGDLRNTIAAEIEIAMQQLQASGLAPGGRGGGGVGGGGGGAAGGGGGRGGRGGAGIEVAELMLGRGGNANVMERVAQLQQQLAQTEQEQSVAYAPVYYPGTPSPSASSPVSIAVSEERGGVDFRLMLVQTAKVEGVVQSQDGALPQNTQVSLVPTDQAGTPPVPGAGPSTTRAGQDGRFTFNNVPPGQYRVMARATVRAVDPAQPADQTGRGRGGRGEAVGPGGRGGPGQIAQVLWGSSDVSVDGQNVQAVTVSLQPGMTVTGRVTFESSTLLPPTDLTRVRVNLTPRGAQQGMDMGGVPPAQVDATGRFTIKGVTPGRYSINANAQAGVAPGTTPGTAGGGRAAGAGSAPAASWALKTALAGGQDALDFGLVIEPNQNVVDATLAFVDRAQEISGTIQDTLGKPTAEYTIILFAADKTYWLPQARRIQSVRPGTDGKFSFRNLPTGEYRLTAVTDVEPGEWFDPNFLSQLVNASIPVSVHDGEKKVQDIKVAGGRP